MEDHLQVEYMHLLHGDLEVEVIGASYLKDTDNAFWNVVPGDTADCWVEVSLAGRRLLATTVRDNVIHVKWGERVSLPVCDVASHLDVTVWDEDVFRPELVGRGKLPLGAPDKVWVAKDPVFLNGAKGSVHMKVSFTPASQAALEGIEVPKAYFPARRGGSLTLYQDTLAPPQPPTGIASTDGTFEAIAKTLRRAKRFIYIAGWSVWAETKLERNTKETLGELLKARAAKGVRVLILLWDEKFSSALCAGLVGTHDAETHRYFEGTGVHVAQVHRQKNTVHAIRETLVEEALWTHHQKAVVADDDDVSDGLVAYVGGIDITNARWDTPSHELFSTLRTEHKDDFHNGFIDTTADQGPREPWHDVHARLTGPCARDVLRNFEERWRKQVPKQEHLLLPTPLPEVVLHRREEEGTTWQMQVVRSIDANSAAFSKDRVGVLDSWGGRTVDTSLHKAFVRLIRRAENFLYIENQYFIGSSQRWKEDTEVNAHNLVPLEIAHRIASRIREGKALRVYLTLPLLPEGNPKNRILRGSMNSILRWQYLTLQMMYKEIAKALKEVGSDEHPTDYLLPLCLAKQESGETSLDDLETPEEGSAAWLWRQRRQFLIYLHSKMIIADDAHVIVGSANFNERSLRGTRDSEIAVSACQLRPDGRGGEAQVKDGVVSTFRKALWAEHTWGISEEEADVLGDPGSLVAIRRIRELADDALEAFAKGRPEAHRCRFIRYPLAVSSDGTVGPRPGMPKVPGFDLSVVGASTYIPPIATT